MFFRIDILLLLFCLLPRTLNQEPDEQVQRPNLLFVYRPRLSTKKRHFHGFHVTVSFGYFYFTGHRVGDNSQLSYLRTNTARSTSMGRCEMRFSRAAAAALRSKRWKNSVVSFSPMCSTMHDRTRALVKLHANLPYSSGAARIRFTSSGGR